MSHPGYLKSKLNQVSWILPGNLTLGVYDNADLWALL